MNLVLTRKRAATCAVMAAVAMLTAVPVASAHLGPPRTPLWHRCSGTAIFGGDSWQTVGGVVHAARNVATQYFVRIRPALPFGWSGTAFLGRQGHATVWIPVGRTHWFRSPVIFTNPLRGRYGLSVNIRPNPGVFNNYSVEVWAAYPCRYWR